MHLNTQVILVYLSIYVGKSEIWGFVLFVFFPLFFQGFYNYDGHILYLS